MLAGCEGNTVRWRWVGVYAFTSAPCSGWLNLKTWFFPRMTLDPVLSVMGDSTLRPFTKQMEPFCKDSRYVYYTGSTV